MSTVLVANKAMSRARCFVLEVLKKTLINILDLYNLKLFSFCTFFFNNSINQIENHKKSYYLIDNDNFGPKLKVFSNEHFLPLAGTRELIFPNLKESTIF